MATLDAFGAGSAICLTGPESTGKSNLAAALAAALDCPLVPEVARTYLTGRPAYTRADVLEIARRQVRAESQMLAAAHGTIVCDTDLLVLQVWWEEKYGALPDELVTALASRTPRVYLLTAADLPWEHDPLRENPHDRERLLARYEGLLDASGFPWALVSGQGEERLANALRALTTIEPPAA